MLPLTKTRINNSWEFKINPAYYGLTKNINATITHIPVCFIVRITYNDGTIKKFITYNFREAFCFVFDNAVKPLFK